MTHVKVRRLMTLAAIPGYGESVTMETDWSMPHATADQFETGVLTITSVETGAVMQTFQPDEWARVSVCGEDGFEQFAFRNETRDPAWYGHVESRERRRTA